MGSETPRSGASPVQRSSREDRSSPRHQQFLSKTLGGKFRRLSFSREGLRSLQYLVRWTPLALCAGVLAGTASAFLIASLAWATNVRESHHWLIALLPVAGLLIGLLYQQVGAQVEAGNNLILDEVHDPKQKIPLRMTPLILLATFVTH